MPRVRCSRQRSGLFDGAAERSVPSTEQREAGVAYAQMLIVGDARSSVRDVDDVVRWHQEHSAWLCNSQPIMLRGTPVVARMGGPSNELLIDGLVAGGWRDSRFTQWEWQFEIRVVWSRHVVRGVRARDVLGDRGIARSSHIELSRDEWSAVQHARLSAPVRAAQLV